MRDHLSRQQYLDQIPRFLPYNPYAEYVGAPQVATVANKTGFYPGIRAWMTFAIVALEPDCASLSRP